MNPFLRGYLDLPLESLQRHLPSASTVGCTVGNLVYRLNPTHNRHGVVQEELNGIPIEMMVMRGEWEFIRHTYYIVFITGFHAELIFTRYNYGYLSCVLIFNVIYN